MTNDTACWIGCEFRRACSCVFGRVGFTRGHNSGISIPRHLRRLAFPYVRSTWRYIEGAVSDLDARRGLFYRRISRRWWLSGIIRALSSFRPAYATGCVMLITLYVGFHTEPRTTFFFLSYKKCTYTLHNCFSEVSFIYFCSGMHHHFPSC